jgi:hypothetical protein
MVLKTYFSNHCVENCGGIEKVNSAIFHIFDQKMLELKGGQPI